MKHNFRWMLATVDILYPVDKYACKVLHVEACRFTRAMENDHLEAYISPSFVGIRFRRFHQPIPLLWYQRWRIYLFISVVMEYVVYRVRVTFFCYCCFISDGRLICGNTS
ncbi:hypothetical protein A0H81_00432 [Grifola frondosa]|uniref:Uncharacterized protein n=1 Tax=Grifola frondosa TaxID=5627 RepID=A0A1C7MS53_GRIFR|nr:hypothetical protein A0H81_00432 [Grifola frondosa]